MFEFPVTEKDSKVLVADNAPSNLPYDPTVNFVNKESFCLSKSLTDPSIQGLQKQPEVFDRIIIFIYITLVGSTCKPGPIVVLINIFLTKIPLEVSGFFFLSSEKKNVIFFIKSSSEKLTFPTLA